MYEGSEDVPGSGSCAEAMDRLRDGGHGDRSCPVLIGVEGKLARGSMLVGDTEYGGQFDVQGAPWWHTVIVYISC